MTKLTKLHVCPDWVAVKADPYLYWMHMSLVGVLVSRLKYLDQLAHKHSDQSFYHVCD